MNVLNLVTTQRPFFERQIETLERRGIDLDTVSVPGTFDPAAGLSRSVTDYLRFYPTVLGRSFGPYDLIHANNGLTALHAIAQPNLPVVVSFWGADVHGDAYAKDRISRLCARLADAVIVMSEEMRRELDCDARVIPHGVDTETFRPMDRTDARDRVGWDHGSKHVLFPYAPSRPEKNYSTAERVVEAAADSVDPPVELHAVHGVPHDRMPLYMNAADALLLTSTFEGSPNAVKEALACNLPVVATDVGDVAERLADVEPSAVRSSESGLIEDLVAVLKSDERSNGRAMISDLHLERMGDRLVGVYESVTDASAG